MMMQDAANIEPPLLFIIVIELLAYSCFHQLIYFSLVLTSSTKYRLMMIERRRRRLVFFILSFLLCIREHTNAYKYRHARPLVQR